MDRLKELKTMMDGGILTKEKFDAKKAKILSE